MNGRGHPNGPGRPRRAFRILPLDHGLRLVLPADLPHAYGPGDLCTIEMLSAERRTELQTEFTANDDDITISDAYEVTDVQGIITGANSRSRLRVPVPLPPTRLDHNVLYQIYVMAKERNGDWRKVKADFKNSELMFPLKGVKFFIAYAQPITEFINVTSSGFIFQSSRNREISMRIPEGAVDGETEITIRMRPVNIDRLNAYIRSGRTANDGILIAVTDIYHFRHTMANAFHREGSFTLPINRVTGDHQLILLTTTPEGTEIRNIDQNRAVQNGQVEIPYRGDPDTSLQVLRTGPGANEDQLTHIAAHLTGQFDLCTVLFFLKKTGMDRYLAIEIVDQSVEERVCSKRREGGFCEIENSRLRG